MRHHYNIRQLEEILKKNTKEFYTPEHPEAKDGIGHEIEHLKGVMNRTIRYADIVHTKTGEEIDAGVAITVAALHDIGNVIARDNHNHFAYGVVKGELPPEAILKIPKKEIQEQDAKQAIQYLNRHGLNLDYIDSLTENAQDALLYAIGVSFQFDIGTGKLGQSPTPSDIAHYIHVQLTDSGTSEHNALVWTAPQNPSSLLHFVLKENAEYNSLIAQGIVDTDKLFHLNVSINKNLMNLTQGLRAVFDSQDLEIIAQAVQDHNVDFNNDDTRYEARSIYGMLVADADKDNVVDTAIARMTLFATNELAGRNGINLLFERDTEEPDKYITKDGQKAELSNGKFITSDGKEIPRSEIKMDINLLSLNIVGQFYQRNRAPYDGTIPLEVPDLTFQMSRIDKIKGLEKYSEERAKQYPELVRTTPKGAKDGEGKKYILPVKGGDDMYSQLDKKFGISDIAKSQEDYIHAVQKWANEKNLDSLIKEVEKVMKVLEQAQTIEAAVDKFENAEYHTQQNSWEDVLNKVFHNTEAKQPGSTLEGASIAYTQQEIQQSEQEDSILNLTGRKTYIGQLKDGIISPPDDLIQEIRTLTVFKTQPSKEVIEDRAMQLADIAVALGYKRALISGAPYLVDELSRQLKERGITPVSPVLQRNTEPSCYIVMDGITIPMEPYGYTYQGYIEHTDIQRDRNIQQTSGTRTEVLNLTDKVLMGQSIPEVRPGQVPEIQWEDGLLNVDELRTYEELRTRAATIADKIRDAGFQHVLISGHTQFVPFLAEELRDRGITPIYPYVNIQEQSRSYAYGLINNDGPEYNLTKAAYEQKELGMFTTRLLEAYSKQPYVLNIDSQDNQIYVTTKNSGTLHLNVETGQISTHEMANMHDMAAIMQIYYHELNETYQMNPDKHLDTVLDVLYEKAREAAVQEQGPYLSDDRPETQFVAWEDNDKDEIYVDEREMYGDDAETYSINDTDEPHVHGTDTEERTVDSRDTQGQDIGDDDGLH